MEPISLTSLRKNLFRFVDGVIKTGIPVEIERKGQKLKIVLEGKKSKLDNLTAHDCIVGSPDDLVNLKVTQWDEAKNL
jgi:predicted nucleotidyltransferase